MAADHIDFWFTMGSTYSYLSVMRLTELQQSSGVQFRWRPFHLLNILQEMKHVPFADKPAKLAYMWLDIDRRAAMYGIPVSLPAPYPAKNSIRANLVAIVGMRQGWGVDFVKAAYRRWFQLGQETGSEPNISESLREIGQEPLSVLAQADADETKASLAAEQNFTLQKILASSDHRRSRSEVSFFGATTALRTQLVGTEAVALRRPFPLPPNKTACSP